MAIISGLINQSSRDNARLVKNITECIPGEVPADKQKEFIELALAAAIAYSVPITGDGSFCTYPMDLYNEVAYKPAMAIIENFNQQYPVNIDNVAGFTYSIWRRRYDLVYSPSSMDTSDILNIVNTTKPSEVDDTYFGGATEAVSNSDMATAMESFCRGIVNV